MRTPALLLALLAGCGDAPAPPAAPAPDPPASPTDAPQPARPSAPLAFTPQGPELAPATRIAHPEIGEASGLLRLGGAWWTHNDSGDTPRVFRSETLDFAKAEALAVPDAMSVDWEDIAAWGDDLLVCDVGDNFRIRPIVTVYRLKVLRSPEGTVLERAGVYTIQYPDGKHDCEGAFVAGGKLHLVSKDRGEGTHVYRFESLTDVADLPTGKRNVPAKIAALDLGDREQVTAADYDAATGEVVLLTYTQIARYPLAELSGKPAHRTWIAARQSEALCVDGKDLVFANEQRDVYVIEDYATTLGPTLLPPRGRAKLDFGYVFGGGPGGDMTNAKWREIPLSGTVEGESLAWRLRGAELQIRGRVRAAPAVKPTDPGSGRLGTGVILEFGRGPKPYVTSEEALFFVGADAQGRITLSHLAFDGSKVVLGKVKGAEVQGAGVTGKGEGAALAFEISLPTGPPSKVLFSLADRRRFRFNALGVGRGQGAPLRFSGLDLYAMYRPYLWGEVLID